MGAVLTDQQIEAFVGYGFVRIDEAFNRELAARCVDVLWSMLDVDRARETWTEPVIRIPGCAHPDLIAAINAPRVVGAVNDLLGGPYAWMRRTGYGTFPVRFPSDVDPGDAGWHVDGSFGDAPFYRVNLVSRGRALLLLMLFSEVTDADAPTRIRVGSHHDVARGLVGVARDGVVFDVERHAPAALVRDVVLATGGGGDVFACHPFLVHAASWPHRGRQPRFVGQPAIAHRAGHELDGFDYDDLTNDSPAKLAVRRAIASRGG